MTVPGPMHVSRIYMKAPIERVWDAIVDPHQTEKYFYDARIEVDPEWKPGARYRYTLGGLTIAAGKVLQVDAPRLLVATFDAEWDDSVAGDAPCRVTWELIPQAGHITIVRVTHDSFDGANATYQRVCEGTTFMLCGLKTWLETGTKMADEVVLAHS
jgi:uncharacterized protein YndB with AHSA1/START domain